MSARFGSELCASLSSGLLGDCLWLSVNEEYNPGFGSTRGDRLLFGSSIDMRNDFNLSAARGSNDILSLLLILDWVNIWFCEKASCSWHADAASLLV